MPIREKDFGRLLEVNRLLSSKLDIDELLNAVLETAKNVVDAEAASLLLLDERRNELYFDVALGSARDQIKQIRLKVGEGVAGWVADKREPLIVNDVTRDSRFTGKVDRSTNFQTRSILAAPLIAMGKLVGVLEAINKREGAPFTNDDLDAFLAFASQAAIAIENARLFSEANREREKLSVVFSQTSEGIVLLDEDQRIALVNDAAARLLALHPADSAGRRLDAALLKGFSAAPSLLKILESDAGPGAVELTREGTKDLRLSVAVHRIQPSKRLPHGGALLFVRDVTEERRGELLKRNFLSLISHKLKTPLTVILGYGPLLAGRSEGLNEFQKKAFHSIHGQAIHLANLVDKLLRFTLVESERLDRTMRSVDLAALVEAAADQVKDPQGTGSMSVIVDSALQSAPSVVADEHLAVEIFKNLIENGLKFNDKKKRIVKVSADVDEQAVRVHVKDNGTGIPSEEKERVFQKFYQIENAFTGQVPGAGLGLPLCRRIIEEFGGEIELQSTLGEGTRVTVRFPRRS